MQRAREGAPTSYFSIVYILNSHLNLSRSLGALQLNIILFYFINNVNNDFHMIMNRIEGLFSTLYNYNFSKNTKWHWEFPNFPLQWKLKSLRSWRLRRLTRFLYCPHLCMLSLNTKHLWKWPLMGPTMAKANFDLLYDVQILLGFITMFPLL